MLVHRRPDRGRWRHLLWSLPLAATPALLAWFAANFALCGISGCAGGGFGVTDVGRDLVVPLLVASGLLLGAGFMSPWHRSLHVRLTVAALVAIGWIAWNALAMTLALMSASPPVG